MNLELILAERRAKLARDALTDCPKDAPNRAALVAAHDSARRHYAACWNRNQGRY